MCLELAIMHKRTLERELNKEALVPRRKASFPAAVAKIDLGRAYLGQNGKGVTSNYYR